MNTLMGFAFKDWWQLLKENNFNIDAGYRGRAMIITIASMGTDIPNTLNAFLRNTRIG